MNNAQEIAAPVGVPPPSTGSDLLDRIAKLENDKQLLIQTGEKLVRWVEGPRHAHEEVRDHNGRLKDTKIWCSFYVAVRGIQRKDTPKPRSAAHQNSRAMAQPPENERSN